MLSKQKDNSNTDPRFVDEYNLSTPFDISTASYAGDSERCELDDGTSDNSKRRVFDLDFTKDGLSFFHSVGNAGSNNEDLQKYAGKILESVIVNNLNEKESQ